MTQSKQHHSNLDKSNFTMYIAKKNIQIAKVSMKLVHLSDTHLGYSEYNKLSAVTGLNAREQDFYDAWNQVIENILNISPDVVIHAGDLFHTPRPSNRAIKTALEGIQKLSFADIPLVLVAGNHETPRIKTTGSIFESIDLFDNVYAVYNSLKKCRIKNIDFHCIPHCATEEELQQAIDNIKLDSDIDYNILVSHGAWTGNSKFSMGEFNELRLPDFESLLNINFDYIALGHYHRPIPVKDHAWYCGSTERTSFNEHDSSCGFLQVDLSPFTVEYKEIKTRQMIKIPPIDCEKLTVSAIYQKLEPFCDDNINQALVSLTLNNLDVDTFFKLDSNKISQMFNKALYLEKQLKRTITNSSSQECSTFLDALPVEFNRFIQSLNLKELDPERLIKTGIDYLESL